MCLPLVSVVGVLCTSTIIVFGVFPSFPNFPNLAAVVEGDDSSEESSSSSLLLSLWILSSVVCD